ncbi:hypothetical protein [Sorangium sp. So ce381]|uniref:hypothetical protein n=1 Tax=Sorangium sp. So ce381 TaxID=3133307 RepID=UPI003F5B945E
MTARPRASVEAWDSIRARTAAPYVAVEEFASDKTAKGLWPYVVISDLLQSGWDDALCGAVALNIAQPEVKPEHLLAAFLLLAGQWPAEPTTALNLLSLAHRIPYVDSPLGKFISRATVWCLRNGLTDSQPLVAEEAVNILGGLGAYHLSAVSSSDVAVLHGLAENALSKMDDADLADALRSRVEVVLDDAPEHGRIDENDARHLMATLEEMWPRLDRALGDDLLRELRTRVRALAWTTVTDRDVHVVHVEDARGQDDKSSSAWGIIEQWIAVLRSALGDECQFSFAPLDVASGSLIVTFRVDADDKVREAISTQLRDAKHGLLSSTAAESLAKSLQSRNLRIHVTHVEDDHAPTSIDVNPDKAAGPSAPASFGSLKLTTGQIPQANDWDKIFMAVDCVASNEAVTEESIGVSTRRQVQYYRAAARIAGLLTPTEELSRTGWLVHVAIGEERYRRACWAFEASECGQAWIEWSNGIRLSDVPPNSAAKFLADRSELTGDTIERRASTLNRWLETLRPYAV